MNAQEIAEILKKLPFGLAIQVYRAAYQISIPELANQLNVSSQYITNIENGEEPDVDLAVLLGENTKIPTAYWVEMLFNEQLKRAGLTQWKVVVTRQTQITKSEPKPNLPKE